MKLQVIDCDYKMLHGRPLIRIFGKTESGEPVCVFYDKFFPYFYVRVEPGKEKGLIAELKKKFDIETEKVKKYLAIGFGEKVELLKITGKDPSNVPEMKEISARYGTPYEADILFKYRFMTDNNINGMDWIDAKGTTVHTGTVNCKALHADSIEPIELHKNVPLKYMAVDIETISEHGGVPDPSKGEIIMISVAFSPKWRGKEKIVLLAKHYTRKDVIGNANEMDMLKKFQEIIEDYDPDVITGYNINGFDMPFITERMKIYNIPARLGRSEKPVFIKKFLGSMSCSITGRVVADTYEIIRKDPRMRFKRYDLRTVARELLGKEKLDMGGPAELKAHWEGGREQMEKLIDYSFRDAELAIELVIEKRLLDKNIELAKVSGLLMQDTFGGQAQRLDRKLFRAFKERDIVMPCKPDGNEMRRRKVEREKLGLKGAIVLEPEVGLHTGGCVLVLDFNSLYPSIIHGFNICPTTYVKDGTEAKHHTAPNGANFVDKEVRTGVLPSVVRGFVEARAAVKKKMRKETDPEKKRQLNARQLALKDMANSLYGYTGYIRSRIYVMDVAGAITSYGRQSITRTKDIVENDLKLKVLYGDTDSVFLKTDILDLSRAEQKGEEISKYITERLEGLTLGFEKTFRTFLILSKKRYAGWAFERTHSGWRDRMEMKGIEVVRRDWCELTTEAMAEVLRIILKEQDAKKAISYTRKIIKDIAEKKVPLEKLTVVKGVTKNLDAYDGMQPHVELAKKIRARDPTRGSMVGERLGYVIIKGNALLSKRAEDPAYVKANNMEIDSHYYIENQLLPPLERIFDALGVSRTEVIEGTRQKSLADMLGTGKTTSPESTVLNSWEKVACRKCDWASAIPSLSGVCPRCGDQIFFSKGGELGKFVKG